MDPDQAIGKRIEALRVSRGLSQDQLSVQLREAGINWSQVTLSKVEAGTRPTKFAEILAIAQHFGVEAVDLSPDGGGVGYQYRKARQQRDDAARRVKEAEQALGNAKFRHVQLAMRTARLRLAVELTSGQRGPYRVNESATDYLRELQTYLRMPEFLTQQVAATPDDLLGVVQLLGIDAATIATARERVRADLAATRADLQHHAHDQPFPDYADMEAWEPPSGDIPHPDSPMFEDDMHALEEHFLTGMAAQLLTQQYPMVRFTTPDWEEYERPEDVPPMVQGLITDD
ncbi:helix-turn-helix domain-containing protein [Nocardia brasiliensis]|uniref:helix-turn-helix domain-containing protein n=1 Tax=Nocardia brasiliensis TaxID=37326 RepID=UPI002458CC1B|nr:helix-turn-helix transcriptional regulator [Nocardia brasiliensis]